MEFMVQLLSPIIELSAKLGFSLPQAKSGLGRGLTDGGADGRMRCDTADSGTTNKTTTTMMTTRTRTAMTTSANGKRAVRQYAVIF
jgi:hypothetical protein